MSDHHFISYSTAEAKGFAVQLCDLLTAEGLPAWLDQRRLVPGPTWDEQLDDAIRGCRNLVFVMTRDSVAPQSVCHSEWSRALRYKKPVIPVLLHRDAVPPFRLESRQYIDFTGDFVAAARKLCDHLRWLTSPAGMLQALKDRLADARRDLRRAAPDDRPRVEDDIARLEREVADQQRIVDDPEGAVRRAEQSIAAGLERERQPVRPAGGDRAGGDRAAGTRFINPPPAVAPAYFQDREAETGLVGEFIRDEATRLVWVVGRGGIGKTAVVCRLLKALESGRLPDGGGPLAVRGIVYLSAIGSRRVNVPHLFADLCRLLPPEAARRLDALYREPKVSTRAKVDALLAEFPAGTAGSDANAGPVVVLLDNFEDVVDPEKLEARDAELDEVLRALLAAPHHAVTVVVTTRVVPRGLQFDHPERQRRVDLDGGLPSPYAQNILRAMDADGKVGLRAAPGTLLDEARERTRGYPRALEALFALLSADRDTTLREVLDGAAGVMPENVTQALVGDAFSRLDPAAQLAMQALAAFGTPVPAAAVDFLLQPYLPGVDSRLILNRLSAWHFTRREDGRYSVHPVDRAYALGRLPRGEWRTPAVDGLGTPTQLALFQRAAAYFKQARRPREEWKRIEDLAPQLAEFEMRVAAEDYDSAAELLVGIDYDYLSLWGFNRLVVEMHERIRGRICSNRLKSRSLNVLGRSYLDTGQVRRAIECHDRALTIDQETNDRWSEGDCLGNLGHCYVRLGQSVRAAEFYVRALAVAQEVGNRRGEGVQLGNLGWCYAAVGQAAQATDFLEQALDVMREVGDRREEGVRLCNLGQCHAALGEAARAADFLERALGVFREVGNRPNEGVILGYLSEVFVDLGRPEDARRAAAKAQDVSKEVGHPISFHSCKLAWACVCTGDLPSARTAAEEACTSDDPGNNHRAACLLGLIALRQRDRGAAAAAFDAAVRHADVLLEHAPELFEVLDSKALASCGRALCGDAGAVDAAAAAFRAARAVTRNAGTVARVLRLFDALAVADPAGLLAGVRPAAAGEEAREAKTEG